MRRNGQTVLNDLFKEWQQKLESDIASVSAQVDQSLLLAHANPDASDVTH